MKTWMRYGFLQAPVFADAATDAAAAAATQGDKSAADKAAADAAAAAAAKGGEGDAAKAAADKAAADAAAKVSADAAAAAAGNKDGKGGDADKGKEGQPPVVPKAPKDFALTVPEGGFLTSSDLDRVKTAAEIYGWTEEQTQQEINMHSAHVKALSESFLTEAKADPEYGGAKYDETQRLADLALNRVRPAGHPRHAAIHSLLNRSGYNHNVEVRALLADIGRLFKEDGGRNDQQQGDRREESTGDPIADSERHAQKLYGNTKIKGQ